MWNKIKITLRWLSAGISVPSITIAAMLNFVTSDDDAETRAKNVQEQVKEYYSTPTMFLSARSTSDITLLTRCYKEAGMGYNYGEIPHSSLHIPYFKGPISEAYALSQIENSFSSVKQNPKAQRLSACFKNIAKELEAEFEAEKTRALSVSLDARITQVEEGKFLEQRINYNFNAMAGFSSLLFLLTFAGRKEQKSAPKSEAVPKEPTL